MEQAAAIIKQKHYYTFGVSLKSTVAIRAKLKELGVGFADLTRIVEGKNSTPPSLHFFATTKGTTREIWLTSDLSVTKNMELKTEKGRAMYGRGTDPRKDVGYE